MNDPICFRTACDDHTPGPCDNSDCHARVLRGMSAAEQIKALGLVVGDTIFGREEHGRYWHEARLTLLWVGEELAVWREQSRCQDEPEWQDMGEVSDWSLDCRQWKKVSTS
jgi:hypothetical protein